MITVVPAGGWRRTRTLPYIPHHTVSPEFAYHFLRYGHNLQYAFFRRKKSKTTWYVFFERKGNLLLVKQEGHYIR